MSLNVTSRASSDTPRGFLTPRNPTSLNNNNTTTSLLFGTNTHVAASNTPLFNLNLSNVGNTTTTTSEYQKYLSSKLPSVEHETKEFQIALDKIENDWKRRTEERKTIINKELQLLKETCIKEINRNTDVNINSEIEM